MKRRDLRGMKVTVMGLGLHGGGLNSALFLAGNGAEVTVTDLRDETILAPAIERLGDLPVRLVLGRHEESDFRDADMVIKNPAVPLTSPYLKMAGRIETDISLFMRLTGNPLIATTGSKGKSTTVTALYHIMKARYPGCRLGGNITVSPLSFIDELDEESPVILELSSWQLADLRIMKDIRPFGISLITNLLNDHQNRYDSFEDYARDKGFVLENQRGASPAVLNRDDEWTPFFEGLIQGESRPCYISASPLASGERGAWLEGNLGYADRGNGKELIIPEEILIPGRHMRLNLLSAGFLALLYGMSAEEIRKQAVTFPGVPHRMEFVREAGGVKYYNDTTATMPDATVMAAASFCEPLHIIMGGSDKELDFSVLKGLISPRIYMLEGNAYKALTTVLKDNGIGWEGPFDSLESCMNRITDNVKPGDVVILSPGCASFGMFINEFYRGNEFKEIVNRLID